MDKNWIKQVVDEYLKEKDEWYKKDGIEILDNKNDGWKKDVSADCNTLISIINLDHDEWRYAWVREGEDEYFVRGKK